MKSVNLFLVFFLLVGCATESTSMVTIKGVVSEVELVAENSWKGEIKLKHRILTLTNGTKYHLSPNIEKGISRGFVVKITYRMSTKPSSSGRVIEAHSVNIVAIPVPGKNIKVKYPLSNPPVIYIGTD